MYNTEHESYVCRVLTTNWPELKDKLDVIQVVPLATHNHGEPGFTNTPVLVTVERILSRYNQGKKHVIFDDVAEAVNYTCINYIHEVYDACIAVMPEIKFYYATAAWTGDQDYNKICNYYNRTDRPLTMLCQSLFERNSVQSGCAYTKEYVPGLREKKFLCFNRVDRPHRIDLLDHMFRLNLVDQSYYSFQLTQIVQHTHRYVHQNKDRLPLILNRSKERENPVSIDFDDFKYYENSYISIVTETEFYSLFGLSGRTHMHIPHSMCGVFPSEKIWKPMLMKHPFILLGTHNFLKALRGRGYKTFHPYINEEYDEVRADGPRLLAVVKEIERLSKFTDNEWIDFTHNVKDILEHNFNLLNTRNDFSITKNVISLFE